MTQAAGLLEEDGQLQSQLRWILHESSKESYWQMIKKIIGNLNKVLVHTFDNSNKFHYTQQAQFVC